MLDQPKSGDLANQIVGLTSLTRKYMKILGPRQNIYKNIIPAKDAIAWG